MKIELVLSPVLYPSRQLQGDHSVVAVDILRATSAVCAAFEAGAEEIVPLGTLEELENYRGAGYTLAAERNGAKVKGAECGNSPTEYMSMDLTGKRLAYSTTNGTVSILCARNSRSLYIGSFANIGALASRLAGDRVGELVVLCSGWKGDPSIEDTLFGGALIETLAACGEEVHMVNDAAMMAVDLWHEAKDDLYGYCSKATHFHRLQRMGCDRDIRWALALNSCRVVPMYDREKKTLVK